MSSIKTILGKFPLIGGLVYCKSRDFSEGFKKSLFNIGVSTTPVWIGALMIMVLTDKDGGFIENYFKTIYSITSNGELFLYTMATMSALVYPAYKKEMESETIFLFTSIISLILSFGFFTLYRAGVVIEDPVLSFKISLILFTISVLFGYLAAVYQSHHVKGAVDVDRQKEADFREKYAKRHGQ